MSSNDGKKRVGLALGACAFAGLLLYLGLRFAMSRIRPAPHAA